MRVAVAGSDPDELLETLVGELQRRNPGAAAHARRVASLALAIGMEMGVPDTELAVVEQAALLHDVGKLALPLELMYRSGGVTADDLAYIRTHPQIAYRILCHAQALRLVADVVRATHEAWDGHGHPRRLAGRDIPIGARIIAVADTWDVLTSGMVGEPCEPDVALAELVRASGTYFEPDVVHAAFSVIERRQRSACVVPSRPDTDGVPCSVFVH